MKGTALITGGRRGIGKAIALALARDGYDIVINDMAVSPELDAVVNEIEGLERKCGVALGDISKIETHETILDEAEKIGPLTTLVNNAGVSVLNRGDLLDVTVDSYDLCNDVNTRGTFFLSQAFAKRLLARKRGAMHHSIINISSSNAVAVSIARGEYCVSKAAVSMVTKLFAARLANDAIGVYEIRPGFIETDMVRPVKAKYDKLIDEGLTAIKRFGQPEDVARVASTMAQGLLPYTVGEAIAVDGGLLTVRY
jgi:NAD(P)-dependent dehydrogenase (short-subunit alcohol dehydrogenase family)